MRQKEHARRGGCACLSGSAHDSVTPRLFRGAVSGSDMGNSFGSFLAAATVAFGFAVGGPTAANAESVMKACASQWKQAQTTGTTGGQSWPEFLAQCRKSQASPASTPASAPAPAPQSGSLFPWSQPSAPASATASNVGSGQSVMKLCASQWKDAKAAGTTGGLSRPQFLGQCRTQQASATRTLGRVCSRSRSRPGPRARLSVGLSVPMVAAVGSGFHARRARDSASRRIHHRACGAGSMSVGHCRVGQLAVSHLPLLGNPLLREHPKGRVYVRSRRARRRISRGEEPPT